MTSTPVKSVGFGLNAPTQAAAGTKAVSDAGFQAVWNNQAGKQTEGTEQQQDSHSVKKTPGDSLKARDEHRARTEKREPSRNVEERTDIPEEKLAEAEGVLAAAAEGMLQEIAEILGVDVQEVTDSLAELDMSVTDILSPGKLGELLLHVRDAGDASALLTEERIYGDFQKLTALLAETLRESGEKLEISPEETKQILEQLEEAGLLEDTVICLAADHYPYGLDKAFIDEMAGHEVEENFELYRSTLILWCGDMEEPIHVEKPCSSLDILPTLSNLFGLRYDSRLLMGQDILSDSEGLVVFSNRSFITEQGRYNARTDEFIPNEGAVLAPDYAQVMMEQVNDMFSSSVAVLDNDYYRSLEPFLME